MLKTIIVPIQQNLDIPDLLERLKKYSEDFDVKICISKILIETIGKIDFKHEVFKFEENKTSIVSCLNECIKNLDEDVIILSQTTIINERLIEQFKECVKIDKSIGIISPISNIELEFYTGEDSINLKEKWIEEHARIIESCSMYKLPLKSSIEFECLYIKKELLEEIGKFDDGFQSIEFAMIDFIFKGKQLGYKHIMADNSYVFSKKKSKKLLSEIDETIIKERYKDKIYNTQNSDEKIVFENSLLYLNLFNGKKNLLYLLQADFREDARNNVGGTQFHVKDLTISLKKEYNIFVAARDGVYLNLTAYIEDKYLTFKFYIGEIPEYPVYFSKKLNEIFDELIKAFSIDIIHIHHTLGLGLDLYYKANEYQIPLLATLHDYYTICPNITLRNNNNSLCYKEENEECIACANSKFNISSELNFAQKWREEHLKALKLCDKIIVPSEDTKKRILKYNPQLLNNIYIIEHGVDDNIFNRHKKYEKFYEDENKKQLNVAFIGGISESKGSKKILKVIKKSSNKINWFILGGIGDHDLFLFEKKNLVKLNWYKREELCELLGKYKIDLVCILSEVPETFCYTLSESLACGVPVISSDIGALGDRAKKYGCNYILNQNANEDDVLELLDEILNNPMEYLNRIKKLDKIKIKNIVEMASDYKELYSGYSYKVKRIHHRFNSKFIMQAYFIGMNLKSEETYIIQGNTIERLNELESKLKEIEESLGYKILKRIRGCPAPIKDLIKKIVYTIAKVYKKFN